MMRFKVSMINDLGNRYEETFIAKRKKESLRNLHSYKSDSSLLQSIFI